MANKVGFIGLGIMGRGMANRLATQLGDSQLVVWNRTSNVAAAFAAQYGAGKITVASSPAEVVQSCGVTYSMLSTMEASHAVFDNMKDGVIDAITPGKVIVDCSTLTPERMAEEDTMITSKGGRFMDAPVSGSKGPAEAGSLVFLCSGEKKVYEEVQLALKVMGKADFYFGAAGQGTKIKLLVNMLMAANMSAFAEALSLCQAAELPSEDLLNVLSLSAIGCPMYQAKGSGMTAGDYSTAFPLKHAQKDMRFALEMADSLGVCLPTTKTSNDQYLDAMKRGFQNDDFSAVMEATRKD